MRILFTCCLGLFLQISASARIVYVKSSATGLNNGTSWLNAYTGVSLALTNAVAGDSIRVAAGTYKPGTTPTSSFNSKNNVILWGGYATDSTITTRNWSLYPTILSGEIGSPTVFDNIETIIICFNVNATSAWDGFIVEAASKNAIVAAANSQATFTNIIFRNNYSSTPTGVVLNCSASAPVFLNCVFYQNSGFFARGIVYGAQSSNPKFTNCLFTRNQMRDTVSVVYVTQSSTIITNCSFFDNITTDQSGQAVVTGKNNSVLNISNSIFFHNLNAIDPFNDLYQQDSSELYLENSTAVVSYSILQNYSTGTSVYAGANPRFKDTSDVDGPDDRFYTADDGLQLTNPCSPAINTGNNAAIAGITTDILGNPRIFNNQVVDLGPYEVQAAPVTPMHTVYVKRTATGTNDGSSWVNAFTDLQKALLYCADTVKVAADTYLPSAVQNPHIAFNLQNAMTVLGGYPNSGNPTDNDRNPQVNITTLSGNLSPDKKSFIVLNSKRNDSTSVIDGFVVRQGGVPIFLGLNRAGSVFFSSSSPVLKKIRITKNQDAPSIQCFLGSKPKFFDCVIDSNAVGANIISSLPFFKRCLFMGNTGGTLLNVLSATVIDSCIFLKNPEGVLSNINNSNGSITNTKFIRNGGLDTGPDIYNDASSPSIANCFFTDSSALSDFGGAIRNLNLSAPVFRSCEFRNYRTQFSGAVMMNDNSSPQFISCIFADNRAGYNAGGGGAVAHNKNYSKPKFINCAAAYDTASYGSFMYNQKSAPEIINTSISKHILDVVSVTYGGVIWNTDSSRLVVKNSILWGNRFPSNDANTVTDIVDLGGAPNVASITTMFNSLTQVFGTNGVNGNIVGIDPRMFEYNDPDGLDNIYFTADDGIKLTPCSPALNAGQNAANAEPLDVILNPRISGSTIDMGAYEFQNAAGVPNVYYVNAAATGNNTGTSWTDAYTNLWSAINNICADTIKVAEGIYKPAVTNRDSSFLLVHGKVYLGGYPATGNPGDNARNPLLHPTLLSGNIGVQSDSTDNTRHVVFMNFVDGAVTMDGFTISHGQSEQFTNPPPLVPIYAGGGILSYASKTTIQNCVIKENYAASGGGMAVLLSPKLKISRTVIQNNRSAGVGGGLHIQTTVSEKPLVENSVIANNVTLGRGGGVYVDSDVSFFAPGIDFNNILLYANDGQQGGGGMYLQSPYKVSVTNCNFINNTCNVVSRGAGLYSNFLFGQDNGYPIVTNNLFKGNVFSSDENLLGSDVFESTCPGYGCFRTNYNYNRFQSFGTAGGGSNNITTQPQFINSSDPDGADNTWMTPDDGLAQTACSPLNEKGSNAAVALIPVDITGNPRIKNGIVDLGAYESQGALVTITASDTLICVGATVVFTAHPVNGGTTPVYQWQVNGVNAGTNSTTFSSSALNNNDQVKVIMTSSESCLSGNVTSNIITMHTSTGVTPSVTISSPLTTICSGTSLAFTAVPVNGGASPAYQWQVNGVNAGTNNPVFTTSTLVNNSQVKVIMTSSLACATPSSATSNTITITVNPNLVPSVSISSSAATICTGTNVVFTATPVNGGPSPAYQWKKNGINTGTNSNTYNSSSLLNNDVISVVMTGNAPCATPGPVTSNSITITVNTTVTPSISISGTTTVTQGASTLITAAPVNGGGSPGYQWQDSTSLHNWQDIAGAVNSTINYTPGLTGDKIRCQLNSTASCPLPATATSNALVFTVNTITAIDPAPAANFGIIYYPNPAATELTIDSLKITDKWQTLAITSVDGKQQLVMMNISNRTRLTVDVQRLAKGYYIAVLQRKQGGAAYLRFLKL